MVEENGYLLPTTLIWIIQLTNHLLNIIHYNLVHFGIIRSVLWFYFTLVIDELSSKILLCMLNLTICTLRVWVELSKYLNENLNPRHPFCIRIQTRIVFEFKLKCSKRWYENLILYHPLRPYSCSVFSRRLRKPASPVRLACIDRELCAEHWAPVEIDQPLARGPNQAKA